MTCYAPIQAYYSASVNPATGKHPMQFKLQGSLSGARQMLPCGRCIGCRLDRARAWAMRIMHESKMHPVSMFLTLTYNNENLPEVGSLVPAHLQGFHKRLHNRLLDSRGYGIRYFGVGEYGDITRRPHYHSIIFGYDFPDKLMYSRNGRDDIIWASGLANEIWSYGDVKIGSLSPDSAMYVAKYCVKKVDGDKRKAGHYLVYDADGVVHERVPEFAHMSRRPGIGARYYEKYGKEVVKHDSVVIGGKEVPSIRYYDLKGELVDLNAMEINKKKRRAARVWSENQVDRKRVREKLKLVTTSKKEHKL